MSIDSNVSKVLHVREGLRRRSGLSGFLAASASVQIVEVPALVFSRRSISRGPLVSVQDACLSDGSTRSSPVRSWLNSFGEPEVRLRPNMTWIRRLCGLWWTARTSRWRPTERATPQGERRIDAGAAFRGWEVGSGG